MARVQLFEGGNISPAEATGARYQSQDFGPGIGPGIEALGQGMAQAAGASERIGELHDDAVVKQATNGISQWFAEAGYTGPNAYFSKKGQDALETRPMIDKGLTEIIKQKRADLQSPRQQRMFDEAVNPQAIDWQVQVAKHAANETVTYATDEASARAGMTAEMASHTYLQDPAQAEQHIATMSAEIANAGRLQGLGPDAIALKQFTAKSGVYHDIGLQIASAGPQGWQLARDFVQQHGGDMTDDARRQVLDRADSEQRSAEAEQRRIESEARRQATEDKRDARDRATTAATNIDLGIPMKPADYAQAMSDAQASGDEALVKRIQVGQFKNGLSIQHQNDTPYQLQARVNDLNASIAKAGADAKPEQVIERDHLSSMLNQSRAQLKANPWGWGAQHLGISVQPLQLSDPNSVRLRMQQTAQLRKATGFGDPLQPDEVAQAQHTLSSGSVQDRVNLALHLSQFGSMAGSAAEQVTNDPGFNNLIGLATHSNRGVAASRVNQIITGQEVLKTKPKLIDSNMAQQQFNSYVGNSLQFLPHVAEGVLANSKALLASQANSTGVSEWGQADPRGFYKAVNSALGAYMKDGKQVGGLATFNGGITVLPENMSQDEFETRISKAHGPQFRAAQNGEPVFADGRSPTATDIKKMRWVPSGDSVYRLTDGNGFLKTKDHRFYEIDVSRLH